MAFLSSLDISGSALTAQKFRMNIIAQNMSNADTTRAADGGAYRRKLTVFTERTGNFARVLGTALGGVEVGAVVESEGDFKLEYSPGHPDANDEGYVERPNINSLEEMIDMMTASRSYDANITAFNAMKEMASTALTIGK